MSSAAALTALKLAAPASPAPIEDELLRDVHTWTMAIGTGRAVGVWAGPAVFLAICPVGIALTRVVTSRAVGDGAYSFYRAAF